MKTPSSGFTLIEVAVIMLLIAILASFLFPIFTDIQERSHITQDLNSLRQLGLATQTYLNDHDGVFFSSDQGTNPWPKSLHPKYLPNWNIFQSSFDKRGAVESDTTSPISYGLNRNIPGQSVDKIRSPSLFILLAPAQNTSTQVQFSGTAAATVTVLRDSSNPPDANAIGGTQNKRTRINALFADLHSETLLWTTFTMAATGPTTDPSRYRWEP